MKKYEKTFLTMGIVFALIFLSWGIVRIVKGVQFDFACTAYLKRAANANTIELAKTELGKAIEYAKTNKLTKGTVSIFLKNPANDIGFWYKNMKSAYEELDNLNDDATALEKTNVLMKLRESLTDNDSSGSTNVITPEGITVYPNNMIYFIWGMGSCIISIVFFILYAVCIDLKIKLDTVVEKRKILIKKD